MEDAANPFWKTSMEELGVFATQNGFVQKGKRSWVRRTSDFVQLINLQRSQWSNEINYLNFALWPLALGEPTSIAESKFHFRARAEDIGANDLADLFARANALTMLAQLSAADAEGRVSGLMTRELRELLRQT